GPLRVGGVDIVDLEPQRASGGSRHGPRGLDEDGEAFAALERDRLPGRPLALDLHAERVHVPPSGAGHVGHGKPEMVELEHASLPHAEAGAALLNQALPGLVNSSTSAQISSRSCRMDSAPTRGARSSSSRTTGSVGTVPMMNRMRKAMRAQLRPAPILRTSRMRTAKV